jgi:alkylhydroperoxidase/carboxymuconolactone decarboxylase family protein YurZ
MKETLVKSVILSGAPRALRASYALKDALEPGDKDSSFVREGLELGKDLARRGNESRRRIYRNNSPLSGDTADAMMDIAWISSNVTYGVILYPISETTPSAPLTLAETEMVVLSCLISQQASNEARWHFRGSLWIGLSEDEIESIQYAIETVAAECGVDVKSGMPRVQDLTEEEKRGQSKL